MNTHTSTEAWHRDWFDEDYLALYGHRDPLEARSFLRALREAGLLPSPEISGVILDLACGAGRHARELCAQGYRVIGLDWSRPLLHAARSCKQPMPVWVRGDLGRLPFRPGAGVVLSLFTSLGYAESDEVNEATWQSLLELPGPEGRIVLDFLNPTAVRSGLVPQSERWVGDRLVHELRRLLPELNMVEKEMCFGPPQGPARRVVERVKLYEADWFLRPARKAGFSLLARWGDLMAGDWDPDSPRNVLVLQRDPA